MYTARGIRNIFIITVILLSYSMLSAQIRIKERVEISPTQTVKLPATIRADYQGITIPPIDPIETALYSNGGFIGGGYDCEDPNADYPFIPRIGGNLKVSFYPCNGTASGDAYNDVLLVFGPDGSLRHAFPLSDLDTCLSVPPGGSLYIHDDCFAGGWYFTEPQCRWNPFVFNQEGYDRSMELFGAADSEDYWMPPYRFTIPVKPWEPLRFRYYMSSSNTTIKCTNCFYQGSPGNWTILPIIMIFRNGHYDPFSHYDPASFFPLRFDQDSTVTGPSPSYIEEPWPLIVSDSGMYRITLATMKPNMTGTLSMTSPESKVIFPDIRNAIGDTVFVGPFSEGTQIQLALSGCIEPGIDAMGYGQWRFGFENWTDYDFSDAMVDVQLAVQPVDHLELWSTSETIYYGDTIDIEIVPCGADSLFSPIGDDLTHEFSIELTGETWRYVELIYDDEASNIVEHVSSYNRRGIGLRLAANKEEPDSVVNLTFHLKAVYLGEIIAASIKDGSITQSPIEVTVNKKIGWQTKDVAGKNSTFGKNEQKKPVIKPNTKRLQSLFINKSRRIGHPINVREKKNVPTISLSKKKILASTMEGEEESVLLENDWALGINPPHEILLGQTIYFQAVEDPIQTPEHQKKLLIIPLEKVSDRHDPALSGVKFTVSRKDGDKLGVYYDEYKDEEGNDLKPDIIRLVGRYWKEGQNYKVLLKAETSSRTGYMLVDVKKPAKLYDESVFSQPYRTTKNIRNEDLDIDELCILYGDSIGISPQVIKGQMFQESNHTGNKFNPSYRYEPWADYGFSDPKTNRYWKDYQKQPFWITGKQPHPMGEGKEVPIPGAHQNVMPIYYPQEPILQGIYAVQNWNEYWLAQKDSVIGSKKLTEKWREDFLSYFKQLSIFPQGAEVILMSRSMAVSSVQTYILGTYTDYAQTRKCASYGLIQMLYTTAQEQGYNKGISIESCSTPEELNDELIEMPLYKKFTEKNLKLQFGSINANVPEGNWPKGWEKTWIDSFKKYNRSKDYGASVFKHSRKFYPQSNKGAI